MSMLTSCKHVEDSRLLVMDNPACNDYCLSNAEGRALAEAAEWARQTLPLSPSHIQAALTAVMYGEVEILTDTEAMVSSGGKASRRKYVVDHDSCTCPGFSTALEGLCKHRAAVAIAHRAYAIAHKLLADPAHLAMFHSGCPSHRPRRRMTYQDGPCWSY
jgi:hypothetical protein